MMYILICLHLRQYCSWTYIHQWTIRFSYNLHSARTIIGGQEKPSVLAGGAAECDIDSPSGLNSPYSHLEQRLVVRCPRISWLVCGHSFPRNSVTEMKNHHRYVVGFVYTMIGAAVTVLKNEWCVVRKSEAGCVDETHSPTMCLNSLCKKIRDRSGALHTGHNVSSSIKFKQVLFFVVPIISAHRSKPFVDTSISTRLHIIGVIIMHCEERK